MIFGIDSSRSKSPNLFGSILFWGEVGKPMVIFADSLQAAPIIPENDSSSSTLEGL